MKDLIDKIVKLEWAFFDGVQNIGGRASCQDDWETFQIMRSSQYEAWSRPMLESHSEYLMNARLDGRNPLTEKYGYMMIISDPEKSRDVAERLPQVSEEKKKICRRITERLLPLNENFRKRCPRLAGRARPLRTEDERPGGMTSVETYQLGELCTYSMQTLTLFEEHLDALEAAGENFVEKIIEGGVKRRGFPSLEAAEKYLAEREPKRE